jgi:hypothetical protein
MKTPASLFLVLVSVVTAYSQGQVHFINIAPGSSVSAPVYQSDGVTKCSGPQFMAQLLAGPSADNLASIGTTGFLTGNGAGYFDGGEPAIPTVGYGQLASIQIDVWNTTSGATFNQAKASGLPNSWWQSSVFTAWTSSPDGGVPSPPGELIGLGNSPVYLNGVPEPSTLTLVALGTVLVFAKVLNNPRHRMSGTSINLKTESRRMPLIGAFCR